MKLTEKIGLCAECGEKPRAQYWGGRWWQLRLPEGRHGGQSSSHCDHHHRHQGWS